MMIILKWIGGLLTGPIIKGLLDGYRAHLDAKNTTERTGADIAAHEIAGEVALRQAETALLIAEQGHWLTRSIRPLLGLAAVIITWKLLVWDLALGQWTRGRTDMLSEQALWLLTTIVAAYMGGRTIEKVAQIIKR